MKVIEIARARKENTYEGEDAKFHDDDFINQLNVIIDKDDETYLATRSQAIQQYYTLKRIRFTEGEKTDQLKYTAKQAKKNSYRPSKQYNSWV